MERNRVSSDAGPAPARPAGACIPCKIQRKKQGCVHSQCHTTFVRKSHAVRVIAVAGPAGKPPGTIPIMPFLPFIAVAAQGQE
jgi:hypothetical protein